MATSGLSRIHGFMAPKFWRATSVIMVHGFCFHIAYLMKGHKYMAQEVASMECSECHGMLVDTQGEGHNPIMPSMSFHQCGASGCPHNWFTCNGVCQLKHAGQGKRRFSTGGIYATLKTAKRHHKQCHESPPSAPSDSCLPPSRSTILDDNNMINGTLPSHSCLQTKGSTTVNDEPPSGSELNHMDSYNSDSPHSDDSALPQSTFLVSDDEGYLEGLTVGDGELVLDDHDEDLFYDALPFLPETVFPTTCAISRSGIELFKSHMVAGNALLAASVIVAQALFQTPGAIDTQLPVANVMLFLYLAKLVISTGKLQQGNLSKVLQILYPYAEQCESSWGPMPCTVSGFSSKITNVTNSHSLVSILPIPSPQTLDDGHGYTPFREVLTHALMMKTFDARETKDPKWKSLASSKKFKAFLRRLAGSNRGVSSIRQIAVGVIVWTDGWDTSTGTKPNRSPMHTGTITLVFLDVASGDVVGIATYPNMGGPGKIDHGTLFQRFQDDMASFEAAGSERTFQSVHFPCEVEIFTEILFVVQDQPERRQASGLLGGRSILHPLFGTSCDFKSLARPFVACIDCENTLHQYLENKDWSQPPMENGCEHCLAWSLPQLVHASYSKPYEVPGAIGVDSPGYSLFSGPGRLPTIHHARTATCWRKW
jgi:hypothetical protein